MSSDKKYPAASDMEYQYAGEDVGEGESLETPKKRPSIFQTFKERLKDRLPKQKKYKVLLFLGIAVYVLYKFLDVGTPPAKSSTPVAAKIEAQQLSPPKEQPKKVVAEKKPAPVPVTPAPVPEPAQSPAQKSIPVLSVGSDTHASSTEQGSAEQNAQIKALQTSVDQMNQSVGTLESSLSTLTNSVIALSNKVNTLQQPPREKNKVVKVVQPPPFLVYYLHSLTNDRAWLMSSRSPKEGLITVKVGDFLPGYGQIQKIDQRLGVISTTSGRFINYGPNDG